MIGRRLGFGWVLTAGCLLALGGAEHVVAQRSLPRSSYFLVHTKGHSPSGRPNRDASRLWVMQFVITDGRPTGVRVEKSYRTQYGLRDEPKRREGDRSTPEGVYHVTDRRKYHPDRLTGPWFFLLDYPNGDDRRRNLTGGAIGIHGGPNRRTLGCIRLRDPGGGRRGTISISDLRQYIELGTPLISVPTLPAALTGQARAVLGEDAAKLYARLLTVPLTNEHVAQIDFSERAWFTEPLKSKQICVLDPFTSWITHRLTVTVSAPLIGGTGELGGVLGLDIKFDDLVKIEEEEEEPHEA